MTIKSMTGYGSQEGEFESNDVGYHWTWDLRSVNGKSLDMRLRLPTFLNELDQTLRKHLQSKAARGNFQVSLQLDTKNDHNLFHINEAALEKIITLSKTISQEHDLAPPRIEGLLSLRGILEADNPENRLEEIKPLFEALTSSFDQALDQLIATREKEGAALLGVLLEILQSLEKLLVEAKQAPARDPAIVREKLKKQIEDIMEAGNDLSEERLHQEALILAAKADIKEELDRISVHIETARDLLQKDDAVGRRLDFLAQEFNREANTVCSKANDITITHIGLAMKAAIEQFREQVQNVE